MNRPDVSAWLFTVLQGFRRAGRTYKVGDTIDRRLLAIGPSDIRKLIDQGLIEVSA